MFRKCEVDTLRATIGERIKSRRQELHLTQTDIARNSDISSGNISGMENGKFLPSALALHQLSVLLKCSIDWIITGEVSNIEELNFSDIEDNLLRSFRSLDESDQEEILELIEFKLLRSQERKK